MTSPGGHVTLSLNGEKSGQRGITVSYGAIKEGGWIAYYGSRVFYFPPSATEMDVQIRCVGLDTLSTTEFLSIEEAQKYLPCLGE